MINLAIFFLEIIFQGSQLKVFIADFTLVGIIILCRLPCSYGRVTINLVEGMKPDPLS